MNFKNLGIDIMYMYDHHHITPNSDPNTFIQALNEIIYSKENIEEANKSLETIHYWFMNRISGLKPLSCYQCQSYFEGRFDDEGIQTYCINDSEFNIIKNQPICNKCFKTTLDNLGTNLEI